MNPAKRVMNNYNKTLEQAEKHFLEYKELYEITKTEFRSADGKNITKISLRLPNDGYNYAVDILLDEKNLFYTGDVGSYSFGREIANSATHFFSGKEINPGYWKQKLWSKDEVEEFDYDIFKQELNDFIKTYAMDNEEATDDELEEWLEENDFNYEYEEALSNTGDFDRIDYNSVWKLLEKIDQKDWCNIEGLRFTSRYLFCCYIIQWISNLVEDGKL